MKTNSGFTFIELLLAVVIASIFLPALSKILSFSLHASSQGEKYSQAYSLAQQGMEAIFTLKGAQGANWNWSSTPVNTSATTYYQPSQTAGVWSLGSVTSTPTITQGVFTQTVQISAVHRCGTAPNLVICTDNAAPIDQTTRKIDVVVSWPETVGTQQILLTSYVTQH